MKCHKCNHKYPIHGNSREEMDVIMLVCPECKTSFEILSKEKMYSKAIFILLWSVIPMIALPAHVSVILLAVIGILYFKWLYRPRNISFSEKNE